MPGDSAGTSVAGSAGAGAAGGAAAGSMFGPWGAAIGAAIGLTGGIIKGEAAKSAGDANASIDRSNANIADQAAGVELENGQQQAGMRAMRGSATEGSQKAGFAASGVYTSKGSALDVLGDTAAVSKLDQDVIQNNAARKAWGYQVQAGNFNAKAAMDEGEGTSAEAGDILSAAASGTSSVLGAMKAS